MATSLGMPVRRRFKRVLTVRHLAAQTAWLDAPARWHEGRVVWPFAQGAQTRWQTPTCAELSAAERALKKIEHYPRATDVAFGDGVAWLKARHAKLAIVQAPVPHRSA